MSLGLQVYVWKKNAHFVFWSQKLLKVFEIWYMMFLKFGIWIDLEKQLYGIPI